MNGQRSVASSNRTPPTAGAARLSRVVRFGRLTNPAARSMEISRNACRSRGFTLVEVVAVVVLIAICISVVTLSFSRNFAGAKVQAASRDLVAALRYTRGQAVVKGTEATFDLNLQNNTYQAPGKGSVQLPKSMRLVLYTAEQEQTSESSGRIRFFPDGASTGGHISVLMDRVEWKISVDWLTGGVTREELRR